MDQERLSLELWIRQEIPEARRAHGGHTALERVGFALQGFRRAGD